MLCLIYCYAEHRYAEQHYAEHHYAEHHYAECIILNVAAPVLCAPQRPNVPNLVKAHSLYVALYRFFILRLERA